MKRTTAIIPIVFCASFIPWLILNVAAESNCNFLNKLSALATVVYRERFKVRIIKNNPRAQPIRGERTIKTAVLTIPFQTRTFVPPFTRPAPMSPPISACDELLGRPSHQVMRFHVIAPTKAEKMSALSTIRGLTMPVPTVFATWTPIKKTATKLKKAAHMTAYLGLSTRVETMVAMEFAES